MSIADLRKEVADAATSAVEGATAEGTAEAEATGEQAAPESGASPDGQSANGNEASAETTETPAAAEGTEVPDEYFGYKFPPDLTPEQRGEILSELKKRDDTIGKLLRGKEPAAEGETPPAPEPEPEPEPITDEEILQALGLDPDDPFAADQATPLLPVVRKQIEQESMIGQLLEMQELAEIDRSWRSSLSGLEKEFGALPAEVTHEDVMEFAAKENIGNPLDAYWRIAGPGRQAVETAASERAAALLAAKKQASTTRPGGGNVTEEAPVESKTVKGATREALGKILGDMGIDTDKSS